MKRKKVLCLLCAAAVMLTSIPYAPIEAYASQARQAETGDMADNSGTEEPTEDIWEDETGLYEVLEQDEEGRELVARSGNIYLTTEYDDANNTVTQYCSEGPQQGNNYDRKTTTQQIEGNEFHSTAIVTTETSSGTTIEEYDSDDNLTRSVAEDGETTVNYYEGGNLVKAIQPYTGTSEDALHTSTYEYDASGNLTSECTPAAQNADGSISYARQEYEYDGEGNLTSYRKAVNTPGEPEAYARTDYAYDGNGNLTMTTEYDKDGSVLAIAQYYYDEEGNKLRQYTGLTSPLTITGLDQVTPGADTDYQVTAYEYEDGRLVKETDPEGRSVSYRYGEDGMLGERTDKDGTRHIYTYREGTYRESERIYYPGNNTDTPDETIDYIQEEEEDGSPGMLTEIRDNGQSTQYCYDGNASLVRETDANGNTVTYEYDGGQNITAISVEDASGSKLGETNYSYNEDGSLAAISGRGSQPVAQYAYDGEGNVQTETAGNGNRTEYEYDMNGLPTNVEIIHADNETAADYAYAYAVDGTLKEETEQVEGTCASYEYDGMGRLEAETVTEDGEGDTVAYSYDASGNRTGIETGEGSIRNEYDGANRLTQAGGDAVSYDGNGNLTGHGGISYEYDARNRLVQVKTPGHTIRYGYDMNGRLISRDMDGSLEQLIWANGAIAAKKGEETTYYYNDMQAGVKASEDAGGMQYYASGKRGDIIETTDESGETIESMKYDAAGRQEKEESQEQAEEKPGEEPQKEAEQEETEPQEEPQGFEPGYTGSFYDHEAGLVYLNARFYSPQLGCFLSEDTVEGNEEELMTLNRYAYCKQNPVNYTDPSGHWPWGQHQEITNNALSSTGFGNNGVMKDCILFSVQHADDKEHFHYSRTKKNNKTGKLENIQSFTLSEASKKRAGLKNLKGYCDEGNVTYGKKVRKENDFGSPYHGRGDYYTYLPYLLGLALQFQKGYQIQNLALRNDNGVYQQMNFDMLIHLSGFYELEKHTNMTRQKYSYLILGIALHLVEDLWAHVAIINDSKGTLEELQRKEKCFKYLSDLEKLRYDQGKPICYLNMSPFCKPEANNINYYGKTHSELAEGNKDGANERRQCARDAAARLLTYYRNGRIMHSGSKKLEGRNQASQTDKKRLAISKCSNIILNIDTYTYRRQKLDSETKKPLYDKETKKPIYVTKELKYARYICRAYSNGQKDSCYLLYFNDKRKRNGKQIMLRLGYAAMN